MNQIHIFARAVLMVSVNESQILRRQESYYDPCSLCTAMSKKFNLIMEIFKNCRSFSFFVYICFPQIHEFVSVLGIRMYNQKASKTFTV